jgi:fructose-bisphosphate aldolase class I
MDADNTIERCYEVTDETLHVVFNALYRAGVKFEGMVLKPNMIVPGKKSGQKASVQQVAEMTLDVLKKNVPAAVAGIAFLSGGQSDQEASAHLNELNKIGGAPWPLTYSYGRALQTAAMETWAGKSDNIAAGQAAALLRARANSAATYGKYSEELETAGV